MISRREGSLLSKKRLIKGRKGKIASISRSLTGKGFVISRRQQSVLRNKVRLIKWRRERVNNHAINIRDRSLIREAVGLNLKRLNKLFICSVTTIELGGFYKKSLKEDEKENGWSRKRIAIDYTDWSLIREVVGADLRIFKRLKEYSVRTKGLTGLETKSSEARRRVS